MGSSLNSGAFRRRLWFAYCIWFANVPVIRFASSPAMSPWHLLIVLRFSELMNFMVIRSRVFFGRLMMISPTMVPLISTATCGSAYPAWVSNISSTVESSRKYLNI